MGLGGFLQPLFLSMVMLSLSVTVYMHTISGNQTHRPPSSSCFARLGPRHALQLQTEVTLLSFTSLDAVFCWWRLPISISVIGCSTTTRWIGSNWSELKCGLLLRHAGNVWMSHKLNQYKNKPTCWVSGEITLKINTRSFCLDVMCQHCHPDGLSKQKLY